MKKVNLGPILKWSPSLSLNGERVFCLEHQSDVSSHSGEWSLYVQFPISFATAHGPWRFALSLFKSDQLWRASAALVRRVRVLDKMDTWQHALDERVWRQAALVKVSDAVDELVRATGASARDKKRMNLFRVLSSELAARGVEVDAEDLLRTASLHLGPSEDWSSSRLEQLRAQLNVPCPELAPGTDPADWIRALGPSNLSFVPDGKYPSSLKSGALVDVRALALSTLRQKRALVPVEGLQFTLSRNFLPIDLDTQQLG